MKYFVYISYRQTFPNNSDKGITCPVCGGEIPPTYTHTCDTRKVVEVEVPGEVTGTRFEKA